METKLKQFNFSGYNLPAKIFWFALLVLSLPILGWSVYDSLSLSTPQLVVLFVSLIVSALANQHQFTIFRTNIKITAREIIIFWGIIWLGVIGGVLFAASASAARYTLPSKNKKNWLLDLNINIIAAFIAGNFFYFVVQNFVGFAENIVGGEIIQPGYLLAAAALMALAHYTVSLGLAAAFLKFERNSNIEEIWRETSIPGPGNHAFGIFAAIVLHFAFLKFGLLFGLVILPIAFVGHIGYRIHLTKLAQKTKEITEASRIHLATVEALATAIDARDQMGMGHVRRTQIYAVGIGETLGLSSSELQALNTGALLHDIGKLAVPDHILNKPGKLTPAETEKMKIHVSVGAAILENVNFSYPVVPTVKYHHELWDGSGYPEGLKKENIPITARILSIADAYDTLRAARPYRPAISRDEARRFLLNGSGTQFDPAIVDVFLRNLRRFEAEVEAQGLAYLSDVKDSEVFDKNNDTDDERNYVQQIKRANREVYTLYELARVFGSSLNLQDTLSLFVKKIGELVPFDSCVIYLSDPKGENARAVYAVGEYNAELEGKRVKAGEGATGFVLKNRKSVYNVEPGMDFAYDQVELEEAFSAMVSLPLIAEEKLLGAVSLYACEIENYEEEHIRLLETVSRIASDAIGVALRHAETESKALTDPMTGLPNARSLQMQFEKEAGRAGRNGSNFHLLMLDLDGFKAVNDTHGHKVGDKLLREISRVLREQLRDYDFLARYAGDEFVAIVPETNTEGIFELCQRMEKAVAEFFLPVGDGQYTSVGVSLGAACYPNHGETLDQIVIAADKAMYARKSERKQARSSVLSAAGAEAELINISCENLETDNFIVELDESHIVSAAVN